MIKVLHIINGAAIGGISSMILNYYSHMDRSKVNFDFVTASPEIGRNGRELEKLGSHFFYIKTKSKGLCNFILQLNRLLKKERFDAIHVHSGHTSYIALLVAWINGVKVRVAHAHNAVKDKLPFRYRISRYVGCCLNRIFATLRVACTKDAAEYVFGSNSYSENTVKILPNAIDVDKFVFKGDLRVKLRKTFNIRSETIVFGTVGTLSIVKNQIFLVEMLKELRNAGKDVCLLLVGDGDIRSELESKLVQYGLGDSAILLGYRTDISELLNIFDVFVIPSLNEGFSIAGLEAGTNGLPMLIASDVPRDLDFFDDAKYIDLKKGPLFWAEYMMSGNMRRNKNAQHQVKLHGYDIKDTVKNLEEIYAGGK